MENSILGIPGIVFWLWFSAFFYALAILLFIRPHQEERSGLMFAFLAFLLGMMIFHIMLGAGFYLNNQLLIYLGSLAALTGAANTLKFPLTSLKESAQKPLFYLSLIVAWLIIAILLVFPPDMTTLLWIVLGYMIIVSGLIAGPYIIWKGLKSKEASVRIKCIGGGAGLIICCLVADLLVLLIGVSILGEIFMSVAPIILILSVYLGRYLEKLSQAPQPSASPLK